MRNQRFWCLETKEELEVLKDLLRRRFGVLLDELSECFGEIDPFEIVYPGNPGEYDGVVREFVVLMQGRDHRSIEHLRVALSLSFANCFDEALDSATESALTNRVAQLDLEALCSD